MVDWKTKIDDNISAMMQILPIVARQNPELLPRIQYLISAGKRISESSLGGFTEQALDWLFDVRDMAGNINSCENEITEYDPMDFGSLAKYVLAGLAVVGGAVVLAPPLIEAAKRRMN